MSASTTTTTTRVTVRYVVAVIVANAVESEAKLYGNYEIKRKVNRNRVVMYVFVCMHVCKHVYMCVCV